MIALSKKKLSMAVLFGLWAAGQSGLASAACTYKIDNEWNTGATGSIVITNSTSAAINGWAVSWQYNTNRLTSSWNANLTGSNPYNASNLGWNGSIQPGQSVTFGFQLDKNGGAIETPTVSGEVCSGSSSSTPSSSSSSSVVSSSSSVVSSSSSSVVVSSSSVYSSSSSSSVVSSVASSACAEQCNWYGTNYTLCNTTTSGWGWENNQSCISRSTCTSQPAPFGITSACGTSSSSSSSSSVPSSSSSSSVRSSSSSSSSVVSSSSVASSSSSSGTTAGVFRVDSSGNITKDGTIMPVHCGNWFGLEGQYEPKDAEHNPGGAPMELYVGNMWWAPTGRTIQQTMTEIKAKGVNVIRLPIAPQTLDATDPQGIGAAQQGGVLKNAPEVLQQNSRQALEDFIKLADQNDLQVVIDIHSCSNYVGWRAGRLDARPPYVDATRTNYEYTREDYSCAQVSTPGVHVQEFNETKWLATLKEVAGLSSQLGVDNILGIDIFNEPWDYTWQEWKTLSEHAYTAINSVNPNVLVFVEGISANADADDGTPDTITPVPHGSTDTNPNWGENLYEAGDNPINIPKNRLVFSPHTYGPSVFVQKQFMDPAQPNCADLEGEAAGNSDCNIVINPTRLRSGWEEHFGYLRDQGYAVVVGEFGGNMDWPQKGSITDRTLWSHITTNVDQQWQEAFASYMKDEKIQACYWAINPESGDTAGWYGHAYDAETNKSGWGTWLPFDSRKTSLLQMLWGN